MVAPYNGREYGGGDKDKFTGFFELSKQQKTVAAGSEIHQYMCMLSQEALRLTAELNNSYRTPEEIREIFSRLTWKPIDDTAAMQRRFTELKTKVAERNVPLPDCLAECLREAKANSTSEYVVANRDGDPLS